MDALIGPLAAWFIEHHRPLPWRTNLPSSPAFTQSPLGLLAPRDAYATLVAETMLQQTQVSRVLEYLARFLEKFPTIAALASADESQVLAAWAGLGYYRRAKLLHRAAKEIVAHHQGQIPRTLEGLLSLPGVGRYTAGAIASIAQHHPAPILDGNITRVLMRLSACESPPVDRHVQAALWHLAESIASAAARAQGTPAIVNEALMELGAVICTPTSPRCQICPVASRCQARTRGVQDSIPLPKPAAKTKSLCITALVIQHDGQVLLQQRPATGLFASMLTPITFEDDAPISPSALRAMIKPLGLALAPPAKPITTYRHQLTHRALTITVYHAALSPHTQLPANTSWHPLAALPSLPIASAHRKALTAALMPSSNQPPLTP